MSEHEFTCAHCGGHTIAYGVEVQGVYDGVLFWVCACGKATSRDWSGYGQKMRSLAADHVARHNERTM